MYCKGNDGIPKTKSTLAYSCCTTWNPGREQASNPTGLLALLFSIVLETTHSLQDSWFYTSLKRLLYDLNPEQSSHDSLTSDSLFWRFPTITYRQWVAFHSIIIQISVFGGMRLTVFGNSMGCIVSNQSGAPFCDVSELVRPQKMTSISSTPE